MPRSQHRWRWNWDNNTGEIMDQEFTTSASEDLGHARPCSLLDCVPGKKVKGQRHKAVVFTLGGADGSVEQVALGLKESRRLLERLAFHLRPETTPMSPEYGTRAWLNRQSIYRAQSRMESSREEVQDDIKRKIPDVWEYMQETMTALKKLLNRKGASAVKPEKVLAKVQEGFLVLVEAVRGDT
jgi:Ser/Thr protein kinase RdoA (MazF antagonist)